MKLTGEQASELVYEGLEGIKVIQNTLHHMSRWDSNWNLVVEREEDHTFWQTMYRQGATENQERGPFEDIDEVEFKQVFPVEKTITVYEARTN